MAAKKRGKILKMTPGQAVQRALSQMIALVKAPKGQPMPIGYRLEGGFNGGFDPEAPHCASYSFGGQAPTADCIGFVLWASGIDRKQPGYVGTAGDWLHCGSLLADAHGAQRFCRTLREDEQPAPGDWLLTKDHIGMVLRPSWTDPTMIDPATNKKKVNPMLVIDCSPRHDSLRRAAISVGYAWSKACEVVRPMFYA